MKKIAIVMIVVSFMIALCSCGEDIDYIKEEAYNQGYNAALSEMTDMDIEYFVQAYENKNGEMPSDDVMGEVTLPIRDMLMLYEEANRK